MDVPVRFSRAREDYSPSHARGTARTYHGPAAGPRPQAGSRAKHLRLPLTNTEYSGPLERCVLPCQSEPVPIRSGVVRPHCCDRPGSDRVRPVRHNHHSRDPTAVASFRKTSELRGRSWRPSKSASTHTQTDTHSHTHTFICSTYVQPHTHIFIRTHVCTYIRTHICIHTHTHARMCPT